MNRQQVVTLRKRYSPIQSHYTTKSAPHVEYGYIYGVKNLSDYQRGGYHPVYINHRLAKRYQMVHKLGYGTFSTVWLVINKKATNYITFKFGTVNSQLIDSGTLLQILQNAISCCTRNDQL
jgi:hypothetical protein